MQPEALQFGTSLPFDDVPNVSDIEYERILNTSHGDLDATVYDCPKCLNRGYFWRVRGGDRFTVPCSCMNTRTSITRLRKSGLGKAAENCRFDKFVVEEEWQKVMVDTAKAFLADKNRQWMLISGQTGCGKTHICTATAVKLLKAGAKTRYIQWVESSRRLQAAIFDEEAYAQQIVPLKRAQVLYIDDFFKTRGNKMPTDKEFTLAFELLNARYNNPELITIISTEHPLRELYEMDAALAGRIAERCGRYIVEVAVKDGRNYRDRFARSV